MALYMVFKLGLFVPVGKDPIRRIPVKGRRSGLVTETDGEETAANFERYANHFLSLTASSTVGFKSSIGINDQGGMLSLIHI